MQTQLNCPQCGTPFTADIHQVIDAQQTPELKQRLLSGQLNVAVCPACGAGGQISTILLFHDAEHELLMVHVPQNINMNQRDREQLIGRLTRQLVDHLPPEKRKAYLFQPQTILNMQTFYEKVLETEGITKEMIDRQRGQAELLNTLLRADKDVVDYLLKQRAKEIDETFFAMLQSYLDAAQQTGNDAQLVKLTNLRAKLMRETPAGKRMEQQQLALHAFSREAKKEGGLSPALLVKHIVQNLQDDGVVSALVNAGQQAINYEFYELLTAAAEEKEAAGAPADAKKLAEIRADLLEMQAEMRAQSQQLVDDALQTLQAILQAPDRKTAVQEHLDQLDETFMYVLSSSIAQADQRGDDQQLQALSEVQA
ncbi:MAG: CpXC domain-containing protein, partial [Anaerolineales bacterium]|nr:CpXC domain-containing protein [Anaerolineales bacterium]